MTQLDNKLSRLVTPAVYQSARAHIFPSFSSWQWFNRANRSTLRSQGALLKLTGRMLVDPDCYDAVVIQVGGRPMKYGPGSIRTSQE